MQKSGGSMAENSQDPPDYSILAALDQKIPRPRTSFFYQCGLLLVTVTMVLLPLIYMAFVGSVAWLVYHHAIHNWGPIMDWGGFTGGGRVMILKFLVYFTPLLAGLVVLFFLFKPIFARRPKHAQPLALNPASEPMLYAFIHKICEAVGAPSPRRIDLDCRLNASAGFRRGFGSFMGNDMVLVIGLPLVANLNARELAGVVAHEFGHFTQGMGMRLSYIIRSINFWFARVAYERDAWDVALETWSREEQDGRLMIVLLVVQLGVWLSRTVLKALMFTGHLIGGFMLRQMEYNADQYQIKISGSEAFESSHRKLATLDATLQRSYEQMRANWKKYRTLPDNLPEALRRQHEKMPAQYGEQINDTLGLRKTGLFDSHPSPGDRIREARRAGDSGIFHDERPAATLFAAFEHPAKFVTLLHYTDDLGIPITQQMLTPVQPEQAAGIAASKPASPPNEWCEAYFCGVLTLMLPLRLGTPSPSTDWETDALELNQLSSGIRQLLEQLAACVQADNQATEKLLTARTVRCLIASGMAVDPARLGCSEATVETATKAEKEAAAARESLRDSLKEVSAALVRRLELGLSLALANRTDAAYHARLTELGAQLAGDAEIYPLRSEVVDALTVLHRIKEMKFGHGDSPALARALESQTQIVLSLAAPFLSKPANEVAPKAGLRLQTTPRLPGGTASNEIAGVETETRSWLTDYGRRLEELVQAASSAEGSAH